MRLVARRYALGKRTTEGLRLQSEAHCGCDGKDSTNGGGMGGRFFPAPPFWWNRVSVRETGSSQPHRFGGMEFRLGKREIGHLHGDFLLDIPFPRKVRDELIESGRVAPHHILPESGWVSFYIRCEEDIDEALRLLNLSLELAKKQREK